MDIKDHISASDEKLPVSASDINLGKISVAEIETFPRKAASHHLTKEDVIAEEPNVMSRRMLLCGFAVCLTFVSVTMLIATTGFIWIQIFSRTACSQTKGHQGPIGHDGPIGPVGPVGLDGPIGPKGLRGPKSSQHVGSTSYIHWGESVCENSAELVYTGLASGGYIYYSGGAVNTQCLPDTPEFNYEGEVTADPDNKGIILTVVYFIGGFFHRTSSDAYSMPCAMCRVSARATTVMIPAVMTCPTGWTKEYSGYLMSNRRGRDTIPLKRTGDTICVDSSAGTVGDVQFSPASDMVFVEGRCNGMIGTSLGSCINYVDGYELTCVVCTK